MASAADLKSQTAAERRKLITATLRREMDPRSADSAVHRFRGLLDGPPREILMSWDIDGLIAAMMLATVTPWRVAALIADSSRVLLHPTHRTLRDFISHAPFGVDIFSSRFPNASQHAVFWGMQRPGSDPDAGEAAVAFDAELTRRGSTEGSVILNPNYWARIEGANSRLADPRCADYRYPMGTSQFLLAVLECLDMSPRLFDREFLPWMIANCDGGVTSFRTYAWNVPAWWSALAAAAGPSTLSEQLYYLVRDQRPLDFIGVVRHLKQEAPRVAEALDDKWNVKDRSIRALATLTAWIAELSGWNDPFLDGVSSLETWSEHKPNGRRFVLGKGVRDDVRKSPLTPADFRNLLIHAIESVHMSFSYYETRRLGFLEEV